MTPLTHVVETWASMYSNSWALRSGISFAHIGGLVGAGGCAIAADRATILASGESMFGTSDRLIGT